MMKHFNAPSKLVLLHGILHVFVEYAYSTYYQCLQNRDLVLHILHSISLKKVGKLNIEMNE